MVVHVVLDVSQFSYTVSLVLHIEQQSHFIVPLH